MFLSLPGNIRYAPIIWRVPEKQCGLCPWKDSGLEGKIRCVPGDASSETRCLPTWVQGSRRRKRRDELVINQTKVSVTE